MNAWDTLSSAIPARTGIRAVATRMRVSYDYVCRWRREPLSDEAPLATGQASPLSRTCDLIDAVFLINPPGAGLIVEHVNLHYRLLTEAQGINGFEGCGVERSRAACDLLQQATAAVCALNAATLNEDAVRQLALLRDAADVALNRVSKDLYYRQPTAGNVEERVRS